ncbi:MAG: N-acetyltransferase family protein [Actinobacteria bacterium]|nr:N-acetyltransferase family protein [Actinomycetota bacterium]
MAGRIAAISRTHPWLVIEDGGRVAAYAYASPHRTRAAYRWAADTAIYVADDYRRRGAGRRLYLALFELMRAQGLSVACAGIALPNPASVGLHEAVGFEPVGIYKGIGWKAGAWRDVGWWQLRLGPQGDGDGDGDGDGAKPPDPGPPARLAQASRLCDEVHTSRPPPVR